MIASEHLLIEKEAKEIRIHKDTHGNVISNGDTVTLIKDQKVKSSSLVIRGGTKIKKICLIDGNQDINCKVDGKSPFLKSEYMKRV